MLKRPRFYIVGPAKNTDAMAQIMGDMLMNPLLRQSDMDMEREVIIQEMAMRNSAPDAWVSDNVHASAFGGNQPISWPIIGFPQVLRAVTRADLLSHKERLFIPSRMAVVVAGGGRLERPRAEELFGSLPLAGFGHER